jgi:hypothetical protein
MPAGANLHRNVIFRNAEVPGKAFSYFDTNDFDPTKLWELLDDNCVQKDADPVSGEKCDVLTIPHNSNLSMGLMFPDPRDAEEAEARKNWEPLVEITQHKGASECRFDRFWKRGVETSDEQCGFELLPALTLLPVPGPVITSPPPETWARNGSGIEGPRAFVRNTLKDGLAFEQRLGVNPFKLGIIGSTDTHNGTPGNTEEKGWSGHAGNQDTSAKQMMTDGGIARTNPGGLAVVWAEENTRDSIFDALRERQTYGTSGTRPIVRFFGGFGYDTSLCDAGGDDLAEAGYAGGVAMGGDLVGPPPSAGDRPSFLVSAIQDPVNSKLQRIEIVKGWVDAAGTTHEKVYDVTAARPDPSPDVNLDCSPVTPGAGSLCAVWTEPAASDEPGGFDPSERAFYYARVLEDPTCRWHVAACESLNVHPFSPSCLREAETAQPGSNLKDCCYDRARGGPGVDPVIQERAWTSPIWYRPHS